MRLKTLGILMALLALAASVGQAETEKELKKLPGYVEFDAEAIFGNQEAKVEVYLKDPMLNLVIDFMGEDDEDLRDVLGKLKLIRVQVYDIDRTKAKELSAVAKTISQDLDKKGWERIVRVREDDERVDVYFKPSAEYEWLDGIVVFVIGEDEEAVFVNVVGEIRPEDVGRLADEFDIDYLSRDDEEDDDDDRRTRDRRK